MTSTKMTKRSGFSVSVAALALLMATSTPSVQAQLTAPGLLVQIGTVSLTTLGFLADIDQLFGGREELKLPGLKLRVTATPTTFDFKLDGGAIHTGDAQRLAATAFGFTNLAGGGQALSALWRITLNIEPSNPAFGGNALTIGGDVQHIVAPHPGDSLEGPFLTFETLNLVHQEDAVGYSDSSSRIAKMHPEIPHWDTLNPVSLAANVREEAFGYERITSFALTGDAVHAAIPVPEPATSFAGIFASFFALRMLLKRRNTWFSRSQVVE